MAKTISAIRATVRQFLRDEFVSGSDQDFQDDELDLYISDCLAEISRLRPYEVKDTTLTTTAASKELDISSIEDLLKVEKAEFPVGNEPPDYRNVSVFGTTLRFEYDSSPAAQSIYLYCWKLHQLTEATSTLSPQLEQVLVHGAVAHAALGWINQVRKQVKEAITRITEVNASIDSMSARITQAMNDLTSGRALINKVNYGGQPQTDYAGYASRELGNANSYLSQSQGYIRELQSRLSISGLINSYQVWANNKLAQYERELKLITKQRRTQLYPTT